MNVYNFPDNIDCGKKILINSQNDMAVRSRALTSLRSFLETKRENALAQRAAIAVFISSTFEKQDQMAVHNYLWNKKPNKAEKVIKKFTCGVFGYENIAVEKLQKKITSHDKMAVEKLEKKITSANLQFDRKSFGQNLWS